MGSSPGDSQDDRTLDPEGENCPRSVVIIGEVEPDLGGLAGVILAVFLPKILSMEKLEDILLFVLKVLI